MRRSYAFAVGLARSTAADLPLELFEPVSAPRRRMPEPLVVQTIHISRQVNEWVTVHEDKHPPRQPIDVRQYGANGPLMYSALRYLVDQSGVPAKIVRKVLKCVEQWTPFSIADDLLAVIGLEWFIDEIPLYANPAWTRAKVVRELRRRGCDTDDVFWEWVDGEYH